MGCRSDKKKKKKKNQRFLAEILDEKLDFSRGAGRIKKKQKKKKTGNFGSQKNFGFRNFFGKNCGFRNFFDNNLGSRNFFEKIFMTINFASKNFYDSNFGFRNFFDKYFESRNFFPEKHWLKKFRKKLAKIVLVENLDKKIPFFLLKFFQLKF